MAKVKFKKKCAVCGDTHQTNVRLRWQRHCDGLIFDVCMLCGESNKVNAESVNKYGPSKNQEV